MRAAPGCTGKAFREGRSAIAQLAPLSSHAHLHAPTPTHLHDALISSHTHFQPHLQPQLPSTPTQLHNAQQNALCGRGCTSCCKLMSTDPPFTPDTPAHTRDVRQRTLGSWMHLQPSLASKALQRPTARTFPNPHTCMMRGSARFVVVDAPAAIAGF